MPTFIPNLRTRREAAPPQAFVDTPNFVYSEWLSGVGGIDAPVGTLNGQSVGIVGAGPAGCAAAFELQKCGAKVVLFDADDPTQRLPGGRLYSSHYKNANGQTTPDIAELGAMRFPPTEEALFYYLNALGIKTDEDFPDPGKVPTWVYYKGKGQLWTNPDVPPEGFERVWQGWVALVTNGIAVTNGQSFMSSVKFNELLQESAHNGSALAAVTAAWQQYLDEFGNDSFYAGLTKIFGPTHKWNVPGGQTWTEEDFTRFGALGIGSGGFGPLYNIGFNYIYRLLTNALETDQMFVPAGISQLCISLIGKFAERGGTYVPNRRVINVQVNKAPSYVTLTLEGGAKANFDRVIVATTTRAMQMGLNLTNAQPELPPNGQTTHVDVGEAINRIHVVSSTKLFLRTRKFWRDQRTYPYPRNLLSDTKCPQLYTLEYNDNPSPNSSGVVLVTYTWEDDSTKTLAFDGPALLTALKQEIAAMTRNTPYSDYADQLVPYNNGTLEDNLRFIAWQETPDYFGAFTLARPGQDPFIDTAFRDFLKAGTATDNLVYVAGDCISWAGGWTEGALHAGLNCVSGVIKSLGGTFRGNGPTPSNALAKSYYQYFPGGQE